MLGDYAGIGPEMCARILSDGRMTDAARIVVVGDARVLQQGMADAGVAFDWHRVDQIALGFLLLG